MGGYTWGACVFIRVPGLRGGLKAMLKRTRDSVTVLVSQALSVHDTVYDVAGLTVWTEVGRVVGRVGATVKWAEFRAKWDDSGHPALQDFLREVRS